jgi:valyl-tRNA synthetase
VEKIYEAKDVEARRYAQWEQRGYFHCEPTPGKPKYSITIPPPNVTGSLHMGHALTYTVQDVLGRWKRMLGYNVLILPGTDHAGIATQNVVEKQIAKDGLTRFDLGREQFVERVWSWKEEYGTRIIGQLKRLGCSFDWQRERFTIDRKYADAVLEAFVRFADAGLIYKGNRMINWCPRCRTVISDIEVEEEEQDGHLWHIRYPFANAGGDGENGYVTVATTRPETMLGDTAVAVNPSDPRYADLIGKMLILPLVGREIPLIADDYASMEMGTGAVKVTPAHDPNDYEAGKRNNLPQITVIGFDGNMTADAGERYSGLDRYDARNLVVADLEELGVLEKVEDHRHRVPICERCKTTIEPLLSDQWFMRMQGTRVVERAVKTAEIDDITFVPDRYKKIYLDWMAGLRDWPLSRQLWWGHRIPIYYREDGTYVAARNHDEAALKAGTDQLTQDEDVLDTWFSSALWPFATLGWPEQTADLAYYYPTDVLTTSREILYLWVARMIMTGLEFTGQKPFDQVYIFATVLDKKGRRMSKSLGNGIDPVEMIDKYGTDALRFSLLRLASKGQDIRFSEDRVPEARNFANKLWNAARFVLMNLGEDFQPASIDPETATTAERWIMSRLQRVIRACNDSLSTYDLDDACNVLHEFVWNEYCDWFVELCKPALTGGDEARKQAARTILWSVLETTLRLLHPVMPFVTEEIWQALPYRGPVDSDILISPFPGEARGRGREVDVLDPRSIMVAAYPQPDLALDDPAAEEQMALFIAAVTALRTLRAEFTPPGQENEAARAAMLARRFTVVIVAETAEAGAALSSQRSALATLARVGDVTFTSEAPTGRQVSLALAGAALYVPADELLEGIDPEKELLRLAGEIARLDKEAAAMESKLNNVGFIQKAAPEVVEKTRQDFADAVRRREKLIARRVLLA